MRSILSHANLGPSRTAIVYTLFIRLMGRARSSQTLQGKRKRYFSTAGSNPGLARLGHQPAPSKSVFSLCLIRGPAVILHIAVILENPCAKLQQEGSLSCLGSERLMHSALCQILWWDQGKGLYLQSIQLSSLHHRL